MRLKLLVSLILFCAIANGQTSQELKDFITKNCVAIRTVQKNMMREASYSDASSLKNILKNHQASTKLYNTDIKASTYFALLARTESLNFLKKHSQGSTKYFEISELEKKFEKISIADYSKVLSASEIKTIDDLDVTNTQNINNLTLTIQ